MIFVAPLDVLLPRAAEDDDEVDTVVQPDLVVVCDRRKITDKGLRGAPDLAVEILSPYTSRKDQREKFDLYQERGVREYWVVDPAGRWLWRYVLGADGRYDQGQLYEVSKDRSGPVVESLVLEGFNLDLGACFVEISLDQ